MDDPQQVRLDLIRRYRTGPDPAAPACATDRSGCVAIIDLGADRCRANRSSRVVSTGHLDAWASLIWPTVWPKRHNRRMRVRPAGPFPSRSPYPDRPTPGRRVASCGTASSPSKGDDRAEQAALRWRSGGRCPAQHDEAEFATLLSRKAERQRRPPCIFNASAVHHDRRLPAISPSAIAITKKPSAITPDQHQSDAIKTPEQEWRGTARRYAPAVPGMAIARITPATKRPSRRKADKLLNPALAMIVNKISEDEISRSPRLPINRTKAAY